MTSITPEHCYSYPELCNAVYPLHAVAENITDSDNISSLTQQNVSVISREIERRATNPVCAMSHVISNLSKYFFSFFDSIKTGNNVAHRAVIDDDIEEFEHLELWDPDTFFFKNKNGHSVLDLAVLMKRDHLLEKLLDYEEIPVTSETFQKAIREKRSLSIIEQLFDHLEKKPYPKQDLLQHLFSQKYPEADKVLIAELKERIALFNLDRSIQMLSSFTRKKSFKNLRVQLFTDREENNVYLDRSQSSDDNSNFIDYIAGAIYNELLGKERSPEQLLVIDDMYMNKVLSASKELIGFEIQGNRYTSYPLCLLNIPHDCGIEDTIEYYYTVAIIALMGDTDAHDNNVGFVGKRFAKIDHDRTCISLAPKVSLQTIRDVITRAKKRHNMIAGAVVDPQLVHPIMPDKDFEPFMKAIEKVTQIDFKTVEAIYKTRANNVIRIFTLLQSSAFHKLFPFVQKQKLNLVKSSIENCVQSIKSRFESFKTVLLYLKLENAIRVGNKKEIRALQKQGASLDVFFEPYFHSRTNATIALVSANQLLEQK